MKQDEILKLRQYVALIIRCWRSNLLISGLYKSDKDLAKMLGITPTAFSRIANQTSTASLVVFHSLQVSIINTLGIDILRNICEDCRRYVYGE